MSTTAHRIASDSVASALDRLAEALDDLAALGPAPEGESLEALRDHVARLRAPVGLLCDACGKPATHYTIDRHPRCGHSQALDDASHALGRREAYERATAAVREARGEAAGALLRLIEALPADAPSPMARESTTAKGEAEAQASAVTDEEHPLRGFPGTLRLWATMWRAFADECDE